MELLITRNQNKRIITVNVPEMLYRLIPPDILRDPRRQPYLHVFHKVIQITLYVLVFCVEIQPMTHKNIISSFDNHRTPPA